MLVVLAPTMADDARKQVRRLLCIDIFDDRRVGGRAQISEQEQHSVILGHPPRVLGRLGRIEAIVVDDETGLAPGDPTLVVDH